MQTIKLNQCWEQTLNEYKSTINNDLFFSEIISPTKLVNIQANQAFVVTKPNNISLLENHLDSLSNVLSQVVGQELMIKLVDSNDINHHLETQEEKKDLNAYIDPSIKYDSYVVGEFNKNAFKLASHLSDTSTSIFNPIFIYSKTGLGKTHLLIAMVNEFKNKYPSKVIHYVEAQTFIREIFNCFEEKNNTSLIEALKNKYCNLDVLVIDDIQYLADKKKTNEILFTIFNHLTMNKKPIIMSSDRPPYELNGFEDRMISRFSSGITCKIDEPDDESVKVIISKSLSARNIYLTDDASLLLTDFCDKDIRKLLGLINKVIFFGSDESGLLNKEKIQNILEVDNKIIGYNKKNTFAHPSSIIETVCKIYNIKTADIVSNSRKKNITIARHVVMYIMREFAKLQLKDIGGFLGNRDHTTVLNGVEKVKSLIASDKEFSQLINSIIKKLS